MSAWMLFCGAGTMIVLGMLLRFESFMASGLVLMWIGGSVLIGRIK